MSSFVTGAERSVAGKITRSPLVTRSSRPPASTMVTSEAGMPGVLRSVSLRRHVLAQLGQPHGGAGVARRAPVAARRERAAGADLRGVRDRRALELADVEEALDEHLEPVLDLAQRVLVAARLRDQVRPRPAVALPPGVPGEEGHLAGLVAEAQDVEEEEVLQLVGPDLALAVGRRLVAL